MGIAPQTLSKEISEANNNKEKPYVVDNPRGFASALVDWVFGSRRRWTNPPAARNCFNCADHQSGFWPKSYLARWSS